MPESDKEFVTRAQAGDQTAFDTLVVIHQERVFALVFRMLGNMEDAQDVQQETFIRAWKHIGRFRGEATFATWLHRIAVNLCMTRRSRPQPVTVENLAEDDVRFSASTSVATRLDTYETTVVVRKALAGIPAHYRALIILKDMESRPFEEIAQILDCSIESARVRTSKARRILRERLRPLLEE